MRLREEMSLFIILVLPRTEQEGLDTGLVGDDWPEGREEVGVL